MRARKIDKLIQSSFEAREMAFLIRDDAFKKMLDEANDLDDFESLAKLGGILLSQAEFPKDARQRPGARSG
jgi:hypothetical protein